jgi:hypothetical protein
MGPGMAQVSATPIPTVNHLLTLPRELRDQIYELCLPEPPVIRMSDGQHPQWLLTCRQVFEEAALMVYEQCSFYKVVSTSSDSYLHDQLSDGFLKSFPCLPTMELFNRVESMIAYIALDVHLDMTLEHMNWLTRDFLAQISDLPNLKALYISLNVSPGVERNRFKQHLARSDLRIFELVKFLEPVQSLLIRLPMHCKVHWAIPESIRRVANGGVVYGEDNFSYMTEFMREVQHAVMATGL